ncbi:MAG: response regulator, partial [Streptosporangiaceae bacterium]
MAATILVAEDSVTVRKLVCARLSADGYQVIEAADGQEALARARADHPVLVVLDKVMQIWRLGGIWQLI